MRTKLLLAAAFALGLPAAARAQDCDRACLIELANGYAAALVPLPDPGEDLRAG